MRIALAQINPHLGNFSANAKKILTFAHRAVEKRAHIVVFSELALFGYPPNDLLERPEIVASQIKEFKKLIKQLPKNITVIFGAVLPNPSAAKKGGKRLINGAVVVVNGKKPQVFAKQLLPTYDVFDETRFFEPGDKTGVVNIPKVGKVAINVCEDMWTSLKDDGIKVYKTKSFDGVKNIDLLVNISASPFSKRHMHERVLEARVHSKRFKAPFVYVNQVGGQDELIFDGRSFILDKAGKLIVQATAFDEDLVMVDLGTHRSEHRPQGEEPTEILRQALVLGLRDFILKTGQKKVHLGVSGGIDSAVVAALAVDALGPGQVTGFLLPSLYSSEGSINDSLSLAKNMGFKTQTIEINKIYGSAKTTVGDFSVDENLATSSSAKSDVSLVEQNLQARIRGMVLMAYSNTTGSMLLATSNKSELATGYSTLYGDMCGGLMPIGDLTKAEVYALAKLYNTSREIIPQVIIDKAPSAELAPGQKDQDTLPPYDELDKAVVRIVEEKRAPTNKVERWLVSRLATSEFKRWQAPPILRVSRHSFGRGRRLPIAGVKS